MVMGKAKYGMTYQKWDRMSENTDMENQTLIYIYKILKILNPELIGKACRRTNIFE